MKGGENYFFLINVCDLAAMLEAAEQKDDHSAARTRVVKLQNYNYMQLI